MSKIFKQKEHNRTSEWTNNVEKELQNLKKVLTHTYTWNHFDQQNWKMSGLDEILGFWFKRFPPIHDRLALRLSKYQKEARILEWMTMEKTTLILKDPPPKKNKEKKRETIPSSYRLITCLPMIWKIITAQIKEEIYYSFVNRGSFPEGQTRCQRGSRGRCNLLHIDQHILKKTKTRKKNLDMD